MADLLTNVPFPNFLSTTRMLRIKSVWSIQTFAVHKYLQLHQGLGVGTRYEKLVLTQGAGGGGTRFENLVLTLGGSWDQI